MINRFPFRSLAASLLAVLLLAPAAGAQTLPFPLPIPVEGIDSFDAAVPTPEQVIGHRIGTRYTWPYQVVDYARAIAATSDRVRLEEHGRTWEGRPLIHAVITSPANQDQLEEIRQQNRRLTFDPADVSDEELDAMPVVLYQGFSIHGNEPSGTDAAVLYLYYLAAGQGPAIDDALRNAVIIWDPMLNPDGRDRFVDGVNRFQNAVPTTDGDDMEHREPWPGGRSNHYWFDLNRDWLPAEHPESRGRLELYHAWKPQLLTDHHEMGAGSTFFFQPGIPDRRNPKTPEENVRLTEALGEFHAAALDRIGSLYYSEESFDDFYYGKGSTYPDINGAIGILFEQAGSSGLMQGTDDGILTYAFTVRNQFTAAVSTLTGAVALRTRFLANQRDFYADVPDWAASRSVKGWVVSTARTPTLARMLLELLGRHGIEARRLARAVEVDGMRYAPESSFVLSLAQAQGRLLDAMFDRVTMFQDSIFYDVSAWAPPLAYDVDHAALRSMPADLVGEAFGPDDIPGGAVVGGAEPVAWLMPWDRYFAPRALYRLQDAGVRPRLATRPFTAVVGGQPTWFDRGVVVIPAVQRDAAGKAERGPDVAALVRDLAETEGVTFYGSDSGLTPEGPDLGGASTESLTMPRIALLAGEGTRSGDVGSTWLYLGERMRLPVSLLEAGHAGQADLSRYNVIVLAGGSYGDMDVDALRGWVRNGGTVVAMGSALAWLERNELLAGERRPSESDSAFATLPYAELSAARGAQAVGGAILSVALDTTHPLAYGLPAELPVFRQGNSYYDADARPGEIFGRYTDSPLLAGYLPRGGPERAAGATAAIARREGRGRLIAFSDVLTFRGYWHGTERLLANAIFLREVF